MAGIASYYIYNRWNLYKKFNHIEKKIEELKPYEFTQLGPFVLYAPQRKYMEKFQKREKYHEWIDNDMRSFG